MATSSTTDTPARTAPRRRGLTVSLLVKIALATLTAGLLPLVLISSSALNGYRAASERATASATALLDAKSLEALQGRTTLTAAVIAQFLEGRVADTLDARLLPATPAAFMAFGAAHARPITYPDAAGKLVAQPLPLYRELALVTPDGQEQFRIADGQPVPAAALRNVSAAAQTTYLTERYFDEALALPPGEVFVSRLTAWHTSLDLQPAKAAGTSEAERYAHYEGVIRFAAAVRAADGSVTGVVVLSLDHRHLMEYALHIQPTAANLATPYPDYATGNYAFVFDDEGYTIVHPLLSRMRGLDAAGKTIGYMTGDMTADETKRHPFNMAYAGWSDPNLPTIYTAVLGGQAGFTITTNRAGAQKASAYAPIPFDHGGYAATGRFGGLVIGANLAEFHKAANQVRDQIEAERAQRQVEMLKLFGLGLAALLVTAALVSRNITRPLFQLAEAARTMERGALDRELVDSVIARPLRDEVTTLAQVFRQMAEQVQLREHRLQAQIVELHIQIDEQRKAEEVAEITETEYFQQLQRRAAQIRQRKAQPPGGDGQ